jgi:hypothetical protein
MKIWIVEHFEIEGHNNLAVCTSFATAMEFFDKCLKASPYESYSIMEYETDVWCDNPNDHYDNPSPEHEVKPIEVAST